MPMHGITPQENRNDGVITGWPENNMDPTPTLSRKRKAGRPASIKAGKKASLKKPE